MTAVEQIDGAHNIFLAEDTPLTIKKIHALLLPILGSQASIEEWRDHKVIAFTHTSHKTVLLVRAITYLGYPHKVFKKRIQLPQWFKEAAIDLNTSDTDVRYIGVYHYEGLNLVVDFDTTLYLAGKSHNSSAHIYTNDLYQALCHGIYRKTDAFGNVITAMTLRRFKTYLEQGITKEDERISIFRGFNEAFPFGQWITAEQAYTTMKEHNWRQWRQAEWAGWLLEYLFSTYIIENHCEAIVVYTGSSLKDKNADMPDFDLFFPAAQHQGDLKVSNIKERVSLGNDQRNVIETINRYGRFWYIIYEHDTIKDSAADDYPATRLWNALLGKDNPLSYKDRMKYSVQFKRMEIIEVNRINFHSILSAFNQGVQPDGTKRYPKFKIDKRDIENFIVFRHTSNT